MQAKTANRILLDVGFHSFKWERIDGKLVGKTWRKFKYPDRIIASAFRDRTIYPPFTGPCRVFTGVKCE